jgi:crotonobetainyl-CoA:carnitine CoA-transferase CaiB-like acyl-CoA transferase
VSGAYQGLRVLDFTHVIAGPLCTRMLADHGADVIKIEPADGDVIRRLPFPVAPDVSTQFTQYNCGKRSVALDLKSPEGLEIARRLALRADVVIENFSRGTMTRLGLDLGGLRADAPALVTCSISAFGSWGTHAHKSGFGYVAEAHSGLMHLNGDDGAFGAIGAALFNCAATGEGTHIDLSAFDCMVSLIDHALAAHAFGREFGRYGTRHPVIVPHGVIRAGDGRYVTFGVVDQVTWGRLCAVMGRPELETDPRFATFDDRIPNRHALYDLIDEWAATVPDADQLVEALQSRGVPCARVRTHVEVASDPHLVERGTLAPVDIPGAGTILTQTAPHPLAGLDTVPRGPAPRLGEHTRSVLIDELGFAAAEVEELIAGGAAIVPGEAVNA